MSGHFLISACDLKQSLADTNTVVLDATTFIRPDPVKRYGTEPGIDNFLAGHIPGAQFVDLQADLSDRESTWRFMLPASETFAERIRAFGVGNESRVVVYSTGDPWWATRLWWTFRVFGNDSVRVLDGGWSAWVAAGGGVETGPATQRIPGDFTAKFHPELVADRSDVLKAMDAGDPIVNARGEGAFRGDSGNLYGRPGRIPGSVNFPAEALYDQKSGEMLPLETQRAALKELPFDRPVIVHCGHGVSASATAFALMRLGHPHVRIYDASLSEWAADESLPLQTGPDVATTTSYRKDQ